ncbi:MAG: hypothetical protein RL472_1108, partial [Pseudomonadota bacterium]
GFQIGVQHIGAGDRLCGIMRILMVMRIKPAVLRQRVIVERIVGGISVQSSPSYRLSGPPGIIVEIACL